MHYYFITIILLFFLEGCNNSVQQDNDLFNKNYDPRGFTIDTITDSPASRKLTVYNPWEKANDISLEYFLVNREVIDLKNLIGKRIIRTPVQRVICLSTTHLAYLEALSVSDKIVGISGSQYVSNPAIRNKIEEGGIPDVGYGQNLNYELIVNLKPDLVIAYGIGGEVTSYSSRLEELNIPVVMVGEYLEESPLGKAGWINFFGALFEKEEMAETYFQGIVEEYVELKRLAAAAKEKPKVLVGSPYKDSWWVPGGNSYLANLIADAGGEYLGRRNRSHESYVISFENALAWGSEADIWINMSNLSSKREILASDERFKSFRVFNEGKLFNNIRGLSSHGGNDFWESGTINPHLVLRDLISIFHPELIEEKLTYYQEIQ